MSGLTQQSGSRSAEAASDAAQEMKIEKILSVLRITYYVLRIILRIKDEAREQLK